jgi:hypothetical protein
MSKWAQNASANGFVNYGLPGGGLSPVFLTSFSVVTVVVPPGVEIFVSCLMVDLVSPLQPSKPTVRKLTIIVIANMRFIVDVLV